MSLVNRVDLPFSTSIFRLFGERRRTTTLFLIRYHGSSGRNRPFAISPTGTPRLLSPCARDHADPTSALASRTIGAPRQSALPTHLGRPRLPIPALRRAVLIESPGSGMASAIAVR